MKYDVSEIQRAILQGSLDIGKLQELLQQVQSLQETLNAIKEAIEKIINEKQLPKPFKFLISIDENGKVNISQPSQPQVQTNIVTTSRKVSRPKQVVLSFRNGGAQIFESASKCVKVISDWILQEHSQDPNAREYALSLVRHQNHVLTLKKEFSTIQKYLPYLENIEIEEE